MAKNSDDARAMIGDVCAIKAADGVALHYEVLGEGPPVALLHGGLVGRSAFTRQRQALAERYSSPCGRATRSSNGSRDIPRFLEHATVSL